jgi:hypothetical protein
VVRGEEGMIPLWFGPLSTQCHMHRFVSKKVPPRVWRGLGRVLDGGIVEWRWCEPQEAGVF